MRLITLGLVNINTTIGAFESNVDSMLAATRDLQDARCHVVTFQEQVIGGYPAEDLIQWPSFVDGQLRQLARFAQATVQHPTVYNVGVTMPWKGNLYNCVATVLKGEILGAVPKEKLPTYGIHYDGRTNSRGYPGMRGDIALQVLIPNGFPIGDLIYSFAFGTMATETCEDLWSPDGPMRRRCYAGAELVCNSSASPFRAGVLGTRRSLISTRAGDNQATVVYVNQVGGNDSLVFDGGGFVNQNGRMLYEMPRWQGKGTIGTCVVDLDRTTRMRTENTTWRSDFEHHNANDKNDVIEINCRDDGYDPNLYGLRYPVPANKNFFMPEHEHQKCPREEFFEDIIEAAIMGMDYFDKTKAFKKVGIAISGGKDSVVTACIARLWAERRFHDESEEERAARSWHEGIGKAPEYAEKIREIIQCFSMPSKFNSDKTRNFGWDVCLELGLGFKENSIQEAFEREIKVATTMLAPGEELTRVTKQNIQTRIRGQRMWNWSNSAGGFWLQTSNMAEKAVGYTTVGGDLMGCLSLIANLDKTVIIEFLKFLANKYGWKSVAEVAESISSAELEEDQEDEKDLMPFPVLGACYALFVGEKLSPDELHTVIGQMWTQDEFVAMRSDFTPELLKQWIARFVSLFIGSIFKWVVSPEAIHMGAFELDRERALQLPVVQSREWLKRQEEK